MYVPVCAAQASKLCCQPMEMVSSSAFAAISIYTAYSITWFKYLKKGVA